MSKNSHSEPIAIVGMAAMYPKSPDLKGFWHLLRCGIDGISEIPASHWSPQDYFDKDPKAADRTYCQRGGFLPPHSFDPTEFSLPPTVLEATDTSQLLGLVVAKAALEDAGYGASREFKRDTTSIILGVTGTLELVVPLGARLGHPIWRQALVESGLAPHLVEEVMQRIANGYVGWQENSFPGLLGNVVAGRIANRLDLHGTNCVVDAACASSLSAAHLAMLELVTGKADMVITGGADTFNDIFMYMCFSKTPALSPSGKIRPFSEESDGTLIGEGLGMVVLKRLSDAQADGDRIYAIIKGIGTASDGNSGAVYAPDSKGQARALRDAYQRAGVDPSTVRLVEAHGTGTKVGDVVEFEGLRSVYAPASPEKNYVALGTVKSQIGHTKAAAGSASLIKAALALYYKVFPPTLGVNRPNPKLNLEDSPFYLNNLARPWLSQAGIPRRAALSSFGFGGSNFHLVLEEAQVQRPEVAWDGSLRLWAQSAASPAALEQALRQSLATLPKDLEQQFRLAHQACSEFQAQAPCRIVLVWKTEQSLAPLLQQAAEAVQSSKVCQGPELFYLPQSQPGKVVFMFPGQGSQYLNMGREWACLFPEVLEALEQADQVAQALGQRIYPAPTFSEETLKAQEQSLTATDVAQPALGAINRGLYQVLSQRFGLLPDFACGHSYGELCALYAANVYDAQALCQLSLLRGQLMAQGDGGRGAMVAVTAPLEKVEAILPELGPEVVIANRNSPSQCVLSGSKEAIAAASLKLKEKGMRAIPLQVGAAFHSPLVASAQGPFRQGLDQVEFAAPRIPVLANKTAQAYPTEAQAMRDLLAVQLVSQVDWVGQVEQLYQQGARTFIEVGPKNVLTKLVGGILKGRSCHTLALDASAGKHSLLDLSQALAHLAALGLPVQLEQWEEAPPAGRPRKMTVELSGANYRAPQSHKLPAPRPSGSVDVLPPPQATAPAPAPIAAPAPPKMVPQVAAQPVLPPEALQQVQSSLVAIHQLQLQAAQAHQRFLEGQEATMKTFQTLVENQQGLMQRLKTGAAPLPTPVLPLSTPKAVTPSPAVMQPPVVTKPPVVAPPVPAPVVKAQPVTKQSGGQVAAQVLAVVSDKTGYPSEMLNLDMDLEADLGIDSIKRVEILAAVQERLPGLNSLPSDQMASLRTLREVVNSLEPGVLPQQMQHQRELVQVNSGSQQQLLAIVAEKTGYPVEMLNLDMDLEADLGIDSIKRVEILAAIPEASQVPSDQMASLRTLREIVACLAPSAAQAPPSAKNSVVSQLLAVVADKTGYPVEMLNLEMDLEADLGIDSIKRVEILAALPEASQVPSDQMASLRTLGQIVAVLAPQGSTPIPAPSSAPLTSKLLAIVADKTGYPLEMLNLEMDLEADLGIDSIKRVEILAAIPEASALPSDQVGSLRTLGQIVAALGVGAGAPVAPAPTASPSLEKHLLQVVADKTGYPQEMLNLEMDLEADLGIDSIKRVEILAAIPEASSLASDQLGSLRTLGQILTALAPKAAPSVPAPLKAAPYPLADKLLKVVADKTGYPLEMLNLEMDLEADLGVDSIKRVEILAALPEASALPSDQVGSLRSLGQILAALQPGSAPAPSKAAAPAAAVSGKLERRVLIATAQAPLALGGNFPLSRGAKVMLYPHQSPLAQALQQELIGLGLQVVEQVESDLAGLFLVGGPLRESFQRVREAAPALRQSRGLLVSLSQLDGRFGLSGNFATASSAGLTGLPKTAAHEWPEVTCRAFDIDSQWRDDKAVAQRVMLELHQSGPLELGLTSNQRFALETPLEELSPQGSIFSPGEVVVVTGGARGVTAATVIALARDCQPTLILLGRSQLPQALPSWAAAAGDDASLKKAVLTQEFAGKASPKEVEARFKELSAQREVFATLAAIRAAGAQVEYSALDVRDLEQVRQQMAEIQSRLGPVRGLIHGAGVLADKRIEEKTDAMFDSVFSTKIQGLENLLAALEGAPLKGLVLFSSVTARFGRPGQVDYCMANDLLNKLAQQEAKKRPSCRVVSLNWGPWAGGMVTAGLKKEFERLGVGLIELEAGAQALVRELSTPPGGAVEVLYGDGFPAPPGGEAPGSSHFQVLASVDEFPCLDSHQVGGRPVVPVALQLEWFAQAATQQQVGSRFRGLRKLQIIRPIALDQGDVPLKVVMVGDHWELQHAQTGQLFSKAVVDLGSELSEAPHLAAVNGLAQKAYPHSLPVIYGEQLFHGPHFQALQEVQGWSKGGMVAQVATLAKVSDWVRQPLRSDWLADPLAVDAALQLGILWGIEALGKPSLPMSVGGYQQFVRKFPRGGVEARLRVEKSSPNRIVASVDFVDSQGTLIAQLSEVEWTADANLRSAFAKASGSRS